MGRTKFVFNWYPRVLVLLAGFLAIWVRGIVLAIDQQLEIYSEEEQEGDGLLLTDKVANLQKLAPTIVNNAKSVCIQGWWRIFPKPNFSYDNVEDVLTLYTPNIVDCKNSDLGEKPGSARYLGASNTEIESISFYSDEDFLGSELVVEGTEVPELPFPPRSLITMGLSSWTVWADKDFAGHTTCYNSTKIVTFLSPLHNPIGSAKLGCTSPTDDILTLDIEKSGTAKLPEMDLAAYALQLSNSSGF